MKHQAAKIPEQLSKGSVYQINPRTFSSKGTIKAITEELPFLADLGFSIMYLCPVFQEDESTDKKNWSNRQLASNTENPKNPYRMNDYFQIDSEYGSMDDLREFVKEAHRLGMRVLLDLVYYHIGPNAPILKEHPEFAKQDKEGNILLGEWHFPVFDYDCQGLREYLYCNMTYYIGEIGVDGFRCDVGDAVPLDFWKEGLRRIQAIKSDAVIINEGAKCDYLTVFHSIYSFHWHECIYDIVSKKIPAYSWEAEDEKIQAEIIGNLYKIWFSHPNVEQIIYWNMVDGYAHLQDPDPENIKASQGDMTIGENYYHGELLRFDLSPKPAFYTIKNLFEKVWHTEEEIITNESGKATFRGFYGEYEITINGKKYNVNLGKNSDKKIIIEV